jgi:adenylate kinase family enzyme
VKQVIVLFSGPIAVGKSTLCEILAISYGFRKISSGEYLRANALNRHLEPSRENLQFLGDQFDVATDFEWIVTDAAKPVLEQNSEHELWFIDSVRKPKQIEHFRAAFTNVVHFHLTATEEVLAERYNRRNIGNEAKEGGTSYVKALIHPNERAARGLGKIADQVLDLSNNSPTLAAQFVARHIGGTDFADDRFVDGTHLHRKN